MCHRGHKKAGVAVAHTILIKIYHLFKDHIPYRELKVAHLNQRDRVILKPVA